MILKICDVCGGDLEDVVITSLTKNFRGKKISGTQCKLCGNLHFSENYDVFDPHIKKNDDPNSGSNLRISRNANEDRPGREFHMVKMAKEILVEDGLTVTFFGAGTNTDWAWVEKKFPKIQTKLVDLENYQKISNFEPINTATPSDVVIACEVIEHFEKPMEHFQSLIRLMKDDGLLICSTNVYDGTDIAQHVYPFLEGHANYWTPLALVNVALKHGLFIDFRAPLISMSRAGPRKKYIIFYKNPEHSYRVAIYFATNIFAPSES